MSSWQAPTPSRAVHFGAKVLILDEPTAALGVKEAAHVLRLALQARDILARVADRTEEEGVVFTLENLNQNVDHPGVPFGRAEAKLALVAAVNHPRLRLNLDLYHAQIGEGNLIELCRACQPWIGEIQVADVPGRCEPGSGEINYAGIAKALHNMGYDGPVGMEAFASDSPEVALADFRAAFTL